MKKSIYIISILFIIFLLLISFGISFYNDKKLDLKHNNIKEEVLSYLKDKYNEEFDIVSFDYIKNSYSFIDNEELVTKDMKYSYIYNLKISSKRLIEFDVTYVVYEEIDEYNDLKKHDIIEPGIYDNYIYLYKIKSIKSEIKNSVNDKISNVIDFDLYIDYFDEENLVLDYSLDSEEEKSLNKKYRELDKNISNLDWFLFCREINTIYALTFDIEVNNYIDNNNLDEFKDEVKDLVIYLELVGYDNYDINFSFKNYLSARATKYDEDDSIYLIFAYVENYTDISEEDRLHAYIIEK